MAERWSAERANRWYEELPLPIGANFVPSSAINPIEMWAAATFDPNTIDRELGWAAGIGMNTMRVYLHDHVWREEGEAFFDRVDAFLDLCAQHGIRPLIVIFDDCWHEPTPGRQPEPRPGIHNSGWVRSPGRDILLDDDARRRLESYVTAVVARFAEDERVLAWDIYNEPCNYVLPSRSLPQAAREAARAEIARHRDEWRAASIDLLKRAFGWARSANPSQPLTAAAYYADAELNPLLHSLGDIVSFHNYAPPEKLERLIASLKRHGRPVWCTEYMARRHGSTFANHLPIFARERIGSWCWGLVDGKSQTKYAWEDESGVWDGAEPDPWFHDVFRADGAPYDRSEVALIGRIAEAGGRSQPEAGAVR